MRGIFFKRGKTTFSCPLSFVFHCLLVFQSHCENGLAPTHVCRLLRSVKKDVMREDILFQTANSHCEQVPSEIKPELRNMEKD